MQLNQLRPADPEESVIRWLEYSQARHRSTAANTDQITVSGDAIDAAVVLRFEAPPLLRKALFDAVKAELRKRGLPPRPVVVNGVVHASNIGDTP
jgi:hypothetical protein